MFKHFSSLSLLSFPASVLCVAACASTPPASLVDARTAYDRASHGPAARLTPADLHTAKTSLTAAEREFENEGASENARDLAYVAQRKAELAEMRASIAASNQNTDSAGRRTDAAKAQTQVETERALDETKNALATEKNEVSKQKAELATEKQGRIAAEQRAAAAYASLVDVATVKQESRGTVITLSGAVIFASGQADLLPGARVKLDQVAAAVAQDPSSKVVVEGHTDSRGSESLNQDLSTRRAAVVLAYLVSKGLPGDSVTSAGFGASRPIADNETAEGRANNRRVEIVIQPN